MQLRLIFASVVFAGLLYLGYWLHGQGYAKATLEHQATLLEAERRNLELTKLYIANVQKIAQEHQDELRQLEESLASADTAVDRLRDAVRNANAGPNTAATCESDAATARSLLATCAGEYRNVARDADRLRATVIGLQDYVRAIQSQ